MDGSWEASLNFIQENKMNNEIFIKSEIKDELMDDNGDISCENLKIDNSDTKARLDMNKNCKEKKSGTFNSNNKINEHILSKSEIKEELMEDSSSLPADYAVNGEFSYEDSKVDVSDTKVGLNIDKNWEEKKSGTCNSTHESNEQLFLKSEIKDELEDSLAPADYGDDDEFSCEDSKVDTKVVLNIDKNWEEKNSKAFNSTNETNERMFLNSEIKKEPVDGNSSILLPETNDTLNASSKVIPTDEKPYQCEVCEKCFPQLTNLKRHSRVHTGEKPYQCDVCKKCFFRPLDLKNHNNVHTGEKPYQCVVCKKLFASSSNLKKHNRVHTGEKPYQCDVCKNGFITSSNLKKHKRVHTGEKPYQCDVCKKCYVDSSQLKKHKRVHTGERPFPCNVCEKSFTSSSDLKKHNRLHTGERPFCCNVCNKSCNTSSDLKKHNRVHTGEKPYCCDICKKCFADSSQLKDHRRVHTGEKPYQCDVCKKCFAISSTLKKHSRVHTGEKPYQCDRCNRGFTRSEYLKAHNLVHIKEN